MEKGPNDLKVPHMTMEIKKQNQVFPWGPRETAERDPDLEALVWGVLGALGGPRVTYVEGTKEELVPFS